MSNNAVQSLIDKIKVVKDSLYYEALMVEQQFNAGQKRENKKASSMGMGIRLPKVSVGKDGIACKWYKRKILSSGQYSEQLYTCPASGEYNIKKITVHSPLWEKDMITEAEHKFSEIRHLSKKVFKLSNGLDVLNEYLDSEGIFIDDFEIEIDENSELGTYALAVIHDLFEQTDEILAQLFKKALDLQSTYYEEWMIKANTHGKAVSGVFPTSRMNKNSLEIRWIRKASAKGDSICISYKKGKNSKYNTHKITKSLPDWCKELVSETEDKMERIRSSSKCLHLVRRCAKDINQAINQSSRVSC